MLVAKEKVYKGICTSFNYRNIRNMLCRNITFLCDQIADKCIMYTKHTHING